MKLSIYLNDHGCQWYAGGQTEPYAWHFSVWDERGSDPGGIKLGEIDVSIPLPQFCTEAAVKALNKRKMEIYAEATQKTTEIEGQIQKLLAIGYDRGEVA